MDGPTYEVYHRVTSTRLKSPLPISAPKDIYKRLSWGRVGKVNATEKSCSKEDHHHRFRSGTLTATTLSSLLPETWKREILDRFRFHFIPRASAPASASASASTF